MSALRRHLRNVDATGEEVSSSNYRTIDLRTGLLASSNPLSEVKHEEITNSIVSQVIDSMSSCSSVENERFKDVVRELENRHVPSGRATISSRVEERQDTVLQTMVHFLVI